MRKCKTISFDMTDELEMKLLKYAESKPNFSRYVKRIIERDMCGMYDNVTNSIVLDTTIPHEELTIDDPLLDYAADSLIENDIASFI